MSAAKWAVYIVIALAGLGALLYVYRRREPAGRGRTQLALLRWSALAVLLLLLFDPRVKQPVDRAAASRAPVLVDGSLSMRMPAAGGRSRWQQAVAEATRRAGNGGIVLFGDEPRTTTKDSIAMVQPDATRSRLLPALQAAAEAGATTVSVITDGDIEDADAVGRWLPRLGLRVEWVTVGSPPPNRTFAEISSPSWAESGKPLDVSVGIQATGDSRDSLRVVLRQDGRVIGLQSVLAAAAGRMANATVVARPNAPAGGGFIRIDASLEGNDGFRDDDVRSLYVYVSDDPAGVVLVSLAPDWEPRFLLPVLERASGLPTRGYLRGTGGMWMRLGGGLDAGQRVPDAVVRSAAANADLLVVHNASSDVPDWIDGALGSARRMLVIPAADALGLGVPVELGTATTDDWFVSADVPASPVALLLDGIVVDDVPPLDAVHQSAGPPGAWSPLTVTRGRRGRPSPLALAGELDGRKWAVALGSGYWRWAFMGGAAGDVYSRLWSSLGGWLTRDTRGADVSALRPVQRAVPRGEPVHFVSRLGALDSLRIRVAADARDRVIVAENDTASLTGLAPGTYRYDATGYAGSAAVTATGEVTVETYSPEFARMPAALAKSDAATALRDVVRASETKPLHTSWIPYVVLLLLLAAEWILRRRWGLR